MSFMRPEGQQLHPDELTVPPVAVADAWAIVHALEEARHLPEAERERLMWAVLDAHVFGPALGFTQ